jgi:pectinesterase
MNKLASLYFLSVVFFVCQTTHAKVTESIKKQTKLVVDKNGKGDFTLIQDAINACENSKNESTLIFIKSGIYKEKLVVPVNKHHISFVGENRKNTIITFDDYSGKEDATSKNTINTFTSYTFLIKGDAISIKNITIENSTCNQGQAVALHVEGTNFYISDSNIIGCQDTLFTGGDGSKQFYKNCYIEGTTDFIFGPATAIFKNCIIKSKKNSYITAASTPENNVFGYVFINCDLISEPDVTKVYLGRPWRPYAQTVFIKCHLGKHIVPDGWNAWEDKRFPDKSKTAYYAEYKSKGSGANPSKRVSWSHQLTKKEAKNYIFNSWDI